MPANLVIYPRRNEDIGRVIKRFTKKVKKLGILEKYKEKQRYVKPSEKRRRIKIRSIRKRKKDQAKQKR